MSDAPSTLIVGGTGFLGGAMTRAAAAAGHRVAVLARGATRGAPPDGVEAIRADRHGDLAPLRGRRFDHVLDSCAYAPSHVERLLDAVAFDGRYALVSSISAYGDMSCSITEDSPTPEATDEQLAEAAALPPERRSDAMAYGAAYGPLKRSAEVAAVTRSGGRALLLRVGLLVGAGDYMDRLPWWVRRIDEGGPVPAPEPRDRPVQVVDVRDVAAFAVSAVERGLAGPFTVTGRAMPMERLLEAIVRVAGSDAQIAWRPEAAFEAAGVAPWDGLPLWLPTSMPGLRHMLDADVSRAHAAGFAARPLEETIRDVLEWDRARRPTEMANGIDRDTEAAVLAG